MKDIFLVGIGGFVGSASRFALYTVSTKVISDKQHMATLLVNLLGCMAIGLIAGATTKTNQWTLLLATGFCGGFTTFSSFALDGLKLLKSGMLVQFMLYAAASIAGGLLLCAAGFFIAQKSQSL